MISARDTKMGFACYNPFNWEQLKLDTDKIAPDPIYNRSKNLVSKLVTTLIK